VNLRCSRSGRRCASGSRRWSATAARCAWPRRSRGRGATSPARRGGNEPPVRARSGSSIVVARDNLGCLRADRHRWVSRPSLKGAKGRDGRARRRRPERLARRRRRRHNVGGGWPGSTFTEGPKSGAVTRNPGAVQSDLVNQQARDIAGASAKRQPSRHVPFVSGGRCGDVR